MVHSQVIACRGGPVDAPNAAPLDVVAPRPTTGGVVITASGALWVADALRRQLILMH